MRRGARWRSLKVKALIPSFTTPDLVRCLAFYRDGLGFTCVSELPGDAGIPGWVELTSGPVRLMLLAAEAPPAPEERSDAEGAIFYFEVDSLAVTRARLARFGVTLPAYEVTFYGMRECYLKDPDGRQLTLAEPSDEDEPVTVGSL
jgi:catechol 2,3-dioxygenase-like lactoylglutathione lyase family enzyme